MYSLLGVRHVVDAGTDVRLPCGVRLRPHRLEESVDPPLLGGQSDQVADQGDPAVAAVQQMQAGRLAPAVVVDDHRVGREPAGWTVQEDERNAAATLDHEVSVAVAAGHHEQCADPSFQQRVDQPAFQVRVLVAVRRDQLEVVLTQLTLDAAGHG